MSCCEAKIIKEINYILAIILYFSLSCETTLLMLSRDRIESTKFIPGTQSLAKLVYYKCKLCGDRDETINQQKSECSNLVQKEYKTRYDWVGKVIHRELCKKLKFDHTNKRYMHNPLVITIGLVWFRGFYGISAFVSYLTPNPFLCK